MVYKINGNSIVNDNREVTVDSVTVTANDRIYAGVTATISPTTAGTFQGTVAGYASGGTGLPGPGSKNNIDRFLFSVDSDATDVGDLTQARADPAGQSSSTHGYTAGGNKLPPAPTDSNTIDRFPFSAATNATDVGDLTQNRMGPSGQSSSTHGYTSTGYIGPPYVNTIDKFPFATNTNATDVGDATQLKAYLSSNSSDTHGYITGGYNPGVPPSPYNTIERFPFASDTNATDVGDLTRETFTPAGESSTTQGFTSGGQYSPQNTIDKFPFASDTNATDHGDLVLAYRAAAGLQV